MHTKNHIQICVYLKYLNKDRSLFVRNELTIEIQKIVDSYEIFFLGSQFFIRKLR